MCCSKERVKSHAGHQQLSGCNWCLALSKFTGFKTSSWRSEARGYNRLDLLATRGQQTFLLVEKQKGPPLITKIKKAKLSIMWPSQTHMWDRGCNICMYNSSWHVHTILLLGKQNWCYIVIWMDKLIKMNYLYLTFLPNGEPKWFNIVFSFFILW